MQFLSSYYTVTVLRVVVFVISLSLSVSNFMILSYLVTKI